MFEDSRKTGRPHGTRAKYVIERCRCFACRVANTDYQTSRDEARRQPWQARHTGAHTWVVRHGETGEIVLRSADRAEAYAKRDALNAEHPREPAGELIDTAAVRRHVRKLQRHGIGVHQVCRVSGVSRSVLVRIMSSDIIKTRRATAQRILAVKPYQRAGGALVPAGPTWELVRKLIAAGHSKASLAFALGYKVPALQIGRDYVTARTERKVAELFTRLTSPKPNPAPSAACVPEVPFVPARPKIDFQAEGLAYLRSRIAAGLPIDRGALADITGFTAEDNTRLIRLALEEAGHPAPDAAVPPSPPPTPALSRETIGPGG